MALHVSHRKSVLAQLHRRIEHVFHQDVQHIPMAQGQHRDIPPVLRLLFAGNQGIFHQVGKDNRKIPATDKILGQVHGNGGGDPFFPCPGEIHGQGRIDQGIPAVLGQFGAVEFFSQFFDISQHAHPVLPPDQVQQLIQMVPFFPVDGFQPLPGFF